MNIYFSIFNTPAKQSEQCETALFLLDLALEREFAVKRGEMGEIVRNPHGKPYFKDASVFFNYSHCKYGAACAVAKGEVGVDIEYSRRARPSVIERVCCDNEIKTIHNSDDFMRIWVQKEAYSKFTGRGFSEGFKSIDTTKFPRDIVFKQGGLYIAGYNATAEGHQLVRASPL